MDHLMQQAGRPSIPQSSSKIILKTMLCNLLLQGFSIREGLHGSQQVASRIAVLAGAVLACCNLSASAAGPRLEVTSTRIPSRIEGGWVAVNCRAYGTTLEVTKEYRGPEHTVPGYTRHRICVVVPNDWVNRSTNSLCWIQGESLSPMGLPPAPNKPLLDRIGQLLVQVDKLSSTSPEKYSGPSAAELGTQLVRAAGMLFGWEPYPDRPKNYNDPAHLLSEIASSLHRVPKGSHDHNRIRRSRDKEAIPEGELNKAVKTAIPLVGQLRKIREWVRHISPEHSEDVEIKLLLGQTVLDKRILESDK